ncbi:MAG: hypothetical protein AAB624_02715 [Patescibacteria group bacterium]
MLRFIAHAGETDSVVAESATHFLENWYYALPLFILMVFGLASIVYLVSKRSVATTYLSVIAMFLISGIYLYDKSPALSAIAITIGLFGSLLSVLTVLSGPKKQ